MKVLVIGSGGREHAIVLALKKSSKVSKIYCAPGNGGIGRVAENVPIEVTDVDSVISFVQENSIDLTFVAPENPLAIGMVDSMEEEGLRVFGPRANAAVLEGSKAFSKEFMKRHAIPTAQYEVFDDADKALEYLKTSKMPIVIKADGLAFGKGVIIAENYDEAAGAIRDMMLDNKFGESGNRIVIEEFLSGREMSVLAFTDGKSIKIMPSAQDHKRVFDGDRGPNTGGMGAYARSPINTDEISEYCMEKIFRPTIEGMAKEGRTFKGVIYFGLIVTKDGVYVIEYNARFGDPETQAVLPLLETDFIDIIDAVIDEKLGNLDIKWSGDSAVCVVLASGGYPGKYENGFEIMGLYSEFADNIIVYHSGTKYENGKMLTNGGRVLGVTAVAESLEAARGEAYKALKHISFENMIYRTDICLTPDGV